MDKKCRNCAVWERDGSDGICKRYAPHPTILSQEKNEGYLIVWPRTNSDQGCYGDFIPFIVGVKVSEA